MARLPRPRVGDTAWFVEWVHELVYYDPEDPESGIDWDSCVSRTRRAANRGEAVRIAREVFPHAKDCLGAPERSVEIYPATFVAEDDADAAAHPHIGNWEVTADPEYLDAADLGLDTEPETRS